jgi:hypothetical protein
LVQEALVLEQEVQELARQVLELDELA